MNLLSHFYIDKDHPSAYFKLGLIFPDIYPHYNQNLRKAVESHRHLSVEHDYFVQGIKRHHEVDKIFHNSPVFKMLNTAFKEALLNSALPQLHYRTYYLGHILVELLIDKQLIRGEKDLLNQFYTSLDEIDENTLHQYFIHINTVEKTSDFFSNFKRFRENRYLYYLNDNEKLIEALMRMYCRVNPATLTNSEKELLVNVTKVLENTYMGKLRDALTNVMESLTFPYKTKHE